LEDQFAAVCQSPPLVPIQVIVAIQSPIAPARFWYRSGDVIQTKQLTEG